MSPCLSQITATRGKVQAGDDDGCGDGTIANSVFAIPAADHQARVSGKGIIYTILATSSAYLHNQVLNF